MPDMPRLVYEGTEYQLTAELILGRKRECSIPIHDAKASRRHARVFLKPDGTAWVEDMESANGTSVNGEELFSPHRLVEGDRISIGKSQVVFRGDAPPAPVEPVEPVASETPDILAATEMADQAAVPAARPRRSKNLVGTVVGGYRIDQNIGEGSMGVVYRSHQLSMHRDVALKLFNVEIGQRDAGFAERFLKAARAAGSLDHPSLARVHECGQDGNLLWYSMEWVDGETVEDLLARDGKVDPVLALIAAEQAAAAMEVAHAKGVIHGDINPAALMLSKEGKIKLLDLGLAQVLNSGRKATHKTVVGNPWYMSPERAKGGPGDARSDIYSLGCVLFHLITGEPPFDDDNPLSILRAHCERPIPSMCEKVPGLAPKFDEILHSMLSKNPEWRYASMREVHADMRALRDQELRKDTQTAAGDKAPSMRVLAANAARAIERSQSHHEHRLRNKLMVILALVGAVLVLDLMGVPVTRITHLFAAPRTEPPPVEAPDPRRDTFDQPSPDVPVPVPPPAPSPEAVRWKQVQEQVDDLAKQNAWGAAEIALKRFADELVKQAADADLLQSVRLRRDQLTLDGDRWYRQTLISLPATDSGARLARLADLRDVTLAANRGEAESLYQEALVKLNQQLKDARRKARQAIETAKPDLLPKLAADLEPAFRDSPVIGLWRQFKAQTDAATGARKLWLGDWAATRPRLAAAKGADAIAAGAILLLADLPEEGKRLLLADPALAQGELLRQREAMFGREAAVLFFKDAGDLQYIETIQGDLRMTGGALTGPAGEGCGLACSVPVGGTTWNASLTVRLRDHAKAKGGGQAVISCVKDNNSNFLLRFEPEQLVVRIHSAIGWEEQKPERPEGEIMRVRLACRGNSLQVLVNNQSIAECAQARIPTGSQLRLEVAGMDWALNDLQVVGGE
jgi:hypothetical protein